MTDYQTLIDAPTWAFIQKTNDSYPENTATLSIADQRAIYDRMCAAFDSPYPAGVTSHDQPIAGVPCRIYPGAQPTVLYLHGGGFVVGGLHSHDGVCADIRGATGLTVVSADYRLSPEHKHPAAFDDACAVARALAAKGPLILVGDSAGANLAAAACHALRGNPQIKGQILIYPGLGGDLTQGSYLTYAHAPMLTRDDVLFYKDIRHDGPAPDADPTVSPLQDTDFTGLPPTLAIAAECDPLADDAPAYAGEIRKAGGRAQSITEPGLVHGYLRARHSVPRATASFQRITDTITAFAQGHCPF
ncbi:alpha/beta hydrolase [Rhodobacter sp. SY28-1]|uniref:alpha/beta hydrolase n=1 Tax=Rhodobacter sp. SY28-1 TaxID=2562317 RepID=UPI0010C0B902|nr:alpha/beta hydrolase [Rhodobacter sp. SY28-1]